MAMLNNQMVYIFEHFRIIQDLHQSHDLSKFRWVFSKKSSLARFGGLISLELEDLLVYLHGNVLRREKTRDGRPWKMAHL